MTRKKRTGIAEAAAHFAATSFVRITAAEITSGRPANWELELAMAFLKGHAHGYVNHMKSKEEAK